MTKQTCSNCDETLIYGKCPNDCTRIVSGFSTRTLDSLRSKVAAARDAGDLSSIAFNSR